MRVDVDGAISIEWRGCAVVMVEPVGVAPQEGDPHS
jgi:hypothetical protein